MNVWSRILLVLATVILPLSAAHPPSGVYTAVEIGRFSVNSGVAIPVDYQDQFVEDVAREISLQFQTVLILHQGEAAPYGHPLLRISGAITSFQPGSRTKRALIGFGAGAAIVQARVRFIDAASGQVLLERGMKGTTWHGEAGGDARDAAGGLAKNIAKLCKTAHLVSSR